MAYFAPYIDGTGIHMPTYEERLEALTEAYRGSCPPPRRITSCFPFLPGRWTTFPPWC